MPSDAHKIKHPSVRNIGLVFRQNSPQIESSLEELTSFLLKREAQVYVEKNNLLDPERAKAAGCLVVDGEIEKKCDLVIVLGGDGTLLTVARKVVPYNVPLIGVNQGRLGFMTDIPKESMLDALADILDGSFLEEERIFLEAKVIRKGNPVAQSLALNDIVFSRGAMGQLIEFEVFIDDLFVYSQRSDGLIVSTPTGSTAYALSAGGPILHPTLSTLTLVPICPQSMSNRPIVVNDNVTIRFLLTKGGDTRVHFDGQSPFEMEEHDEVFIQTYPKKLRILHPKNYDYYHTLRQKLHWGGRLV